VTRRDAPENSKADLDDQAPSDVSALRGEIEVLRARLAQADERMSAFMARLAHELRTPLGAILMWAHVLRTGRDADRDGAIDAIDASARAQSKLIGDLLDLVRATAGRLRIDRAWLDLRGPVQLAVEGLRSAAEARAVMLEILVPDRPVDVMGDGSRLRDLVSSLVDNGIKFTPEGGSVDVRLLVAGPTARIVVRDTGRGIPREELPEIFGAFRSSTAADRPTTGGLGIGLAFVRLLAELHSGTVRAESDGSGRGSTFVVEIPLLRTPG
jgi:signal transduction histidine kinase